MKGEGGGESCGGMEGPQFLLTDQQLGNALDDIEEGFKAGMHPRDGVGLSVLAEERQSSRRPCA